MYDDVYASVFVYIYMCARVVDGSLGSACGLMKIQHDLSHGMNWHDEKQTSLLVWMPKKLIMSLYLGIKCRFGIIN